ncbi:hypothetical protein NSA45_13605 [Paraclostridium bifermentans]|nr:hypothetical protein [Paraclostridium bifermentans]MCR1876904.1 hypothetical protein [Paraclostridium bifermentans]
MIIPPTGGRVTISMSSGIRSIIYASSIGPKSPNPLKDAFIV